MKFNLLDYWKHLHQNPLHQTITMLHHLVVFIIPIEGF